MWPMKKLLEAQEHKGELYSYQIVVILLALENLAGKNDFGISLYHAWITSRKKRDPYQSTVNIGILARSFEINGFSDKFPLEVDPTDHLLNGGTHRTACSIFYNIETAPVTYRRRTGLAADNPKYYGINYFLNSSLFTKQDIRILTKRWEVIKEKYGLTP
jgi:hypothetical protein